MHLNKVNLQDCQKVWPCMCGEAGYLRLEHPWPESVWPAIATCCASSYNNRWTLLPTHPSLSLLHYSLSGGVQIPSRHDAPMVGHSGSHTHLGCIPGSPAHMSMAAHCVLGELLRGLCWPSMGPSNNHPILMKKWLSTLNASWQFYHRYIMYLWSLMYLES